MENQTGFIFKVLVISAGLSVLIKYAGPALEVGATPVNALILVFVPTLIVAIALWWRAQQQGQQN
ncbi:hypothetical protein [Microseira wollei]|uniref:Uncharacterized protein n=1 Tax=Microseira wollei NIES-4236 TaxID=2530354 RepID=A0AAV3XHK5_9CYAN|nr:hypothetical protein [Microseira wollei]GET40226.1 hypothetical protein MiSe_50350 [Microseira wollei NIES-4236]